MKINPDKSKLKLEVVRVPSFLWESTVIPVIPWLTWRDANGKPLGQSQSAN